MQTLANRFIVENFYRGALSGTNTDKPRIGFVDLAKGVCIILVVIFHTEVIPDSAIPNLRALRMPLYFILSGLFYRDYAGLPQYLNKKFNRILLPFLFYYIASFMLIYVLKLIVGAQAEPLPFSQILNPLHQRMIVNLPLWFLPCLFFTGLYFKLFRMIAGTGRPILLFIMVVAASALGVYISQRHGFAPFHIDSALTALPYFYTGYLMGNAPLLYPNRHDRYNWLLGIVFIGIAYAGYHFFGDNHVIFFTNTIVGNPLLAFANSFFFVTGILLVCKAVAWLPIVSYIGRFSIIVLCTHMLVRLLIQYFCVAVIKWEPTPIAQLALTLTACWIAIPFMKEYFPTVNAQKDFGGWGNFRNFAALRRTIADAPEN